MNFKKQSASFGRNMLGGKVNERGNASKDPQKMTQPKVVSITRGDNKMGV